MSEKKPAAGEWWRTRGGEIRFVVGVSPSNEFFPIWSTDTDDYMETHSVDGNVMIGKEWREDLVEHLPDCTGFDWQPEAEQWPKYREAWSFAFVRRDSPSSAGYVDPDGSDWWFGEWTDRDETDRNHLTREEALARLNPQIPTCPDCNQPATDGHADVCPEAWVTQDRVPARGDVDERRWIYQSGGAGHWESAKMIQWCPQAPSNGHIASGMRLEIRCRRKYLPTSHPEIPDNSPLQRMIQKHVECMGCTTCGEFCEKESNPADPLNWPHSTTPDQVQVRLWQGDDCQVYATEDGEPLMPEDEEITVDSQGRFWLQRSK